ncbi:Vanillate O-demethylase oxidoreductase [Mesorhizobium metallidurans STM 2683]|uniref:Vanillate O-demethylase oxidoreductase n=1 Tax=Mesorhizobium metallidurans STM 2683 TaxID=1297569 RepID=M5EZU9_9HYPH|nr:PDR/VanB family oxidoreductase [Mesorhizobium metallidurans]CCV09445.1 Vanillate O-demethylase oxidoreductase [Mesorhizobium metallidurans STM 2683]
MDEDIIAKVEGASEATEEPIVMYLKISNVSDETASIRTYSLVNASAGVPLPEFSAGSHIIVRVTGSTWRQYSLVNTPGLSDHYLISVLREQEGRGGSQWIHENWKVGDIIETDGPANNFKLDESAGRVILIAGGIGITPILSMARRLQQIGTEYHLYYCARSVEETAHYAAIVNSTLGRNVTFIHNKGTKGGRLDVSGLLSDRKEDCHVYVCGPHGLVEAVKGATRGWPPETVHYELFGADPSAIRCREGDSEFTVTIGSTGESFAVPAGRSILRVLADNGVKVSKLCEEGYCGSCLTPVVSGKPDHRDSVLTQAERNSGELIALCCSRAESENLILDL